MEAKAAVSTAVIEPRSSVPREMMLPSAAATRSSSEALEF